jgi:hypothetical protein
MSDGACGGVIFLLLLPLELDIKLFYESYIPPDCHARAVIGKLCSFERKLSGHLGVWSAGKISLFFHTRRLNVYFWFFDPIHRLSLDNRLDTRQTRDLVSW